MSMQRITEPEALFGLGKKIDDPAHFSGEVYVKEISSFEKPMLMDSVTFTPGCYNAWHIHQVGQMLFVTDGRGWYQEEGKPAQELLPSDIVDIPAGVKHWHGAAKDSSFTHLAVEDWSKGAPEWFDLLDADEYAKLK